jgi:hypothetical protein
VTSILSSLEKRLIQDGFNADKMDAILRASPALSFETRSVSLFFILRAGKMDHSQLYGSNAPS